ncbi:MAG: EAL domain-containing protein [Rhodospirillales bacterium]|nr:EAL domain-containing protein [Rhodospirillales bacterium]
MSNWQHLRGVDLDVVGLSLTSESLVDAVVVTTAEVEPRIEFANGAFAQLVGYSPEFLRKRTLSFLQRPQDYAGALSRLHAEVTERGSFFMETVLRRRTGEPVIVEWQATPVACEDGESRHLFNLLHDVSHHRREHAALVDEQEKSRVALEAIGDAVVSIDGERRIDDMNGAAEVITGWKRNEARGRPVGDVVRIIDHDGRELAADPAAHFLSGSATFGRWGRLLLISHDGRRTAVETFAAPLRAVGGGVRGAVLVLREEASGRRPSSRARLDAAHDPLTGLINRAEFERRLDAAVTSAGRFGRSHVLCYIDLDNFRQINETFGRSAGDAVLRQVAGLLRGRFRERDTIARLGGDGFGLLLSNCTLNEAEAIAKEVVANFSATRFLMLDAPAVQITPSLGLVEVTSRSGSARQLLSEGDIACYTAKKLGRGRSHIYRRDRTPATDSEPVVLYPQAFRDALEEDRFQLYYQPIVPLQRDSGLPVHYEFLLRHRGDSGQLVLPRTLIAAAERHGLMAAVDRWVIRTAIRHLAQGGLFARAIIAINLSGNSLDDPGLVDFVTAQFAVHPVAPRSVCFEITETEAIRDLGHAVGVVGGLKKLGCSIALDDFGSGQSSFAYLKALPADYLKIDGNFVRQIIDSSVDRAVVSAINETGRIMGLKTIAEFAHNAEVIDCLRRLRVDFAQGDAISPPRPIAGAGSDARVDLYAGPAGSAVRHVGARVQEIAAADG